MSVLVTGGLGYIGSHTVVELIENGYDVVIVDNLYNANKKVLDRIKKITGIKPKFYQIDVQDEEKLNEVFNKNQITDVIHFAGYKAVGESVINPEMYYCNNICSTLVLLKVMKEHEVYNIVFSSSATVYGKPTKKGLKETDFVGECSNPYGETKFQIEKILTNLLKWNKKINAVLLRYFNPIGAHKSGLIGENPNGVPNNLMPYITQVATKKREFLSIFGDDYDTIDGTGVRDYIHVLDLAAGHIAALKSLEKIKGVNAYNLGTGKGTSVLELVHAFEKANKIKIPYQIVKRRPGDLPICFADPSKANKVLKWKAKHTIKEACEDSYNWQKKNPNGY